MFIVIPDVWITPSIQPLSSQRQVCKIMLASLPINTLWLLKTFPGQKVYLVPPATSGSVHWSPPCGT